MASSSSSSSSSSTAPASSSSYLSSSYPIMDINPPPTSDLSSSSSENSTLYNYIKNKNWTVPSDFLILPPAAASLGLVIGMVRGGRRARLRFIAENAHRQPTTVQGWYFYSKTRNYKVFFESSKQGGRTALALGGATALYVFLEEYIAYLREETLGQITPRGGDGEGFRRNVTWRKGGPVWWDGALAGVLLGAGVGLSWRLPPRLITRCIAFGGVMGGTHSGSRVLSSKVAIKIQEDHDLKPKDPKPIVPSDIPSTPYTPSSPPPPASTIGTSSGTPAHGTGVDKSEHPIVDRDAEPAPRPPSALPDIDDLLQEEKEEKSWWSSWTSRRS